MARKAAATDLVVSDEEAFGALEGIDFDQYEGAGNENVGSDDIQIPYISIIQKMSPEVDADSAKYLENAKVGQIMQNVNMHLWDSDAGLEIVPVAYERAIIEWVPREKGGGFVNSHPQNLDMSNFAKNDKGIPLNDKGNLMVDTAIHYVLYLDPDTGKFEPALLTLKSTGHKANRLWNSLLSQQTIPGRETQAPRWLFRWKFTTELQRKDENTWYAYEFEKVGVVDTETFNKAATLHTQYRAGTVKGADTGPEDDIPFG